MADKYSQFALLKVETQTKTDDDVSSNIEAWWDSYDGDALQYQRTKMRILQYLLAKYRSAVDTQIGMQRYAMGQKITNVQKMISELRTEIGELISVDTGVVSCHRPELM